MGEQGWLNMVALPDNGDLLWGSPLNAGILFVESKADTANTSLTTHQGASDPHNVLPSAAADATSKVAAHTAGTDPHADRAYTDTNFAKLTGTNLGGPIFRPSAIGVIALAARAITSQTANTLEIQDSGGTARVWANSTGTLFASQGVYSTGNTQLASASQQWGSGTGVVGVGNATVIPTTNPAAGIVIYSEGGVLKVRDQLGVVTVLTGTSTSAMTKASYNILSVMDYGAVGNGTTDDTAAIQAALDAAAPGAVVLLPRTHAVTAPIKIPPQVTLRGNHGGHIDDVVNPTLKPLLTFTGAAVILMVDQTTGGYPRISVEQRIENISIDGTLATGSAIDGIQAQGYVHGVYIDNVQIRKMSGRGLQVVSNGSGTPYSWHVFRLHVSSSTNNSINASMTDSAWIDCEALGSGGHGWFVAGAANSSFVACRSEWSTFNGWEIGGSTGTGTGSGGWNMIGCTTDRNAQHGVNITSTGNGPIVISGCTFRRDGRASTSAGWAAICIASATAPISISGFNIYPGVNDDGAGNLSPQIGITVTGSTSVSYSDAFIHAATTTIVNGGGNTKMLRGLNVRERTGSTAAPTILVSNGLIVDDASTQTTTARPTAIGNKALVVQSLSGQTANLMEVQNSAGTAVAYFNNFHQFFTTSDVRVGTNLQAGGISGTFGSGVGVVGITDATTAPTTTPTGGGVLYSQAGALKWRGSAGTVTTIAVA